MGKVSAYKNNIYIMLFLIASVLIGCNLDQSQVIEKGPKSKHLGYFSQGMIHSPSTKNYRFGNKDK